jgi:uncharacterized RDD family membrane protein YckC
MRKCSYCGVEYPDDVAFCPVDQQPLGGSPPVVTAYTNKSPSAGFGIRFLARLIDLIFGMVLGLGAGFVAGILIVILNAAGKIDPGWQYRVRQFTFTGFGLSLLGDFLYHFFCEGIHGATLGKLCCGIRVLKQDMKPSSMYGASIRSLAYYIDAFFFGLVGYISMSQSPLNQRYGDVWGKTVVVKVKEVAPESLRSPTYFIFGLLAGAGFWALMLMLGIILKAME